MSNNEITRLRNQLDEINLELLNLLNERTKIVTRIGLEKQESNLSIYDESRETAILKVLNEKNEGPMSEAMLEHIFKEIFKASVKYQEEIVKK